MPFSTGVPAALNGAQDTVPGMTGLFPVSHGTAGGGGAVMASHTIALAAREAEGLRSKRSAEQQEEGLELLIPRGEAVTVSLDLCDVVICGGMQDATGHDVYGCIHAWGRPDDNLWCPEFAHNDSCVCINSMTKNPQQIVSTLHQMYPVTKVNDIPPAFTPYQGL